MIPLKKGKDTKEQLENKKILSNNLPGVSIGGLIGKTSPAGTPKMILKELV
jgi:hypothetical protein